MTPFYFGPAGRKLFAIYHAPPAGHEVKSALLVCGPFGHEAIRIHRLFRVLAERLARQGIAVLRFDYYGTGESGGEDSDGEMKGWRLDLLRAHEELGRRSGAPHIGWLAARISAALALQSASHAQGLQRLVLWDPVLDGAAYIDELRSAHAAAIELGFYAGGPMASRRRTDAEQAELSEALGHALSPDLLAQLRALRPEGLRVPAELPAAAFAAEKDTCTRDWCEREKARGSRLDYEVLEHPIVWTADPLPNHAIVPTQVTTRLASALQ